jgi:hypothetical protein
VDKNGECVGAHVAELHHPHPHRQLEQEPRRQQDEQHDRHDGRPPVCRHHLYLPSLSHALISISRVLTFAVQGRKIRLEEVPYSARKKPRRQNKRTLKCSFAAKSDDTNFCRFSFKAGSGSRWQHGRNLVRASTMVPCPSLLLVPSIETVQDNGTTASLPIGLCNNFAYCSFPSSTCSTTLY